jgi:hypothetical protein
VLEYLGKNRPKYYPLKDVYINNYGLSFYRHLYTYIQDLGSIKIDDVIEIIKLKRFYILRYKCDLHKMPDIDKLGPMMSRAYMANDIQTFKFISNIKFIYTDILEGVVKTRRPDSYIVSTKIQEILFDYICCHIRAFEQWEGFWDLIQKLNFSISLIKQCTRRAIPRDNIYILMMYLSCHDYDDDLEFIKKIYPHDMIRRWGFYINGDVIPTTIKIDKYIDNPNYKNILSLLLWLNEIRSDE